MTIEFAGCSVAGLSKGESFIVEKVTAEREIGKRLADMGFTRGAEGTLVRRALLGDPIEIRIRGYSVSIRKSEAEKIMINRGSLPLKGE